METTVSTSKNVQIIQEAFENFAKGNIQPIIDNCADDVAWGSFKVPGATFSGQFYGKEGVEEFFKELKDSIEFTVFEPTGFISEGDHVIVLGHQAGYVKSTGKNFESDWCFHYQLKDGKLQRYFAFLNTYDVYRNFNL